MPENVDDRRTMKGICLGPGCSTKLKKHSVFPGYGYDGNGYFHSLRCALDWAVRDAAKTIKPYAGPR